MIRHWGYPAENYEVITADGFILSLFRIPHGRASETNNSCHRPVVIFSHGLAGDSTEFFFNPPKSSPAFLLADAGFDVFLINHRGGTYSRKHTTLKPSENKFWQWTLDELAKYDIPAAIDKALEVSRATSLYWIGHSMGSSLGYMTLASNPFYNRKVKALFQLAPTGSLGYAQGPTKLLHYAYPVFQPLLEFYRKNFGAHELPFKFLPIYRQLISICNFIPQACHNIYQFFAGPSAKPLNISRGPVYISHAMSGTNTWTSLHYGQMASHRRIEHFDHNPVENKRRYGQESPPPYDYSVITVPVYHFWSRNDFIATREDIDKTIIGAGLRKDLVKWIEVPEYNHFDYGIAVDVGDKVITPITKIVRERETGMCAR